LPIAFKIGKINKIRVLYAKRKLPLTTFLPKNKYLGLLFTIFVAFLAENSSFKLILATHLDLGKNLNFS